MKRLLFSTLVLSASLSAETAPGEGQIPETTPVKIACQFPEAYRQPRHPDEGDIGEPVSVYHYTAYLPAGYHANPTRAYPVLWVSFPQGGGHPMLYKDILDREQMIGIGLVEARNGPVRPIMENYAAALVDASNRFRMAPGFIIATGFSGAARSATYFAGHDHFGGVLLQGGGLSALPNFTQHNPSCCVYGVFGITDFNAPEGASLSQNLPAACIRRFSLQSGGHTSAHLPDFAEGMEFLLDTIHTRRENPHPNAMAQHVIRFQLLFERAKAANGIAKYEALEAAYRVALARKFATDETLAGNTALHAEVADVARQLEELARNPQVSVELEARAAYQKVRGAEDAGWPASVRDLGPFAKQHAAEYGAVAVKFPDTFYGKKAADRAAWLSKGV